VKVKCESGSESENDVWIIMLGNNGGEEVDNGCRYPKFPIGMQASSRICIPHKVFLDPAEYSIDECLTNHASSLGCGCGNKTQLFSFLVRCISLKHDEIIENIVPRYEFLCFNSYQDLSSRVFFFFFISLIRNKD